MPTDLQGNSFHPNKAQQRPVKAGWQLYGRERSGMILKNWWVDPDRYRVVSQRMALMILNCKRIAGSK